MKEHSYSTVPLPDWQSFKRFIADFSDNWAFRGQANASWVLNNAIERTLFINFRKGIEAEFVAEFQRGARNYLSRDETPHHLIEWLALMQHHGAPTRLLDLTRSPFIASYFAFEHCPMREEHTVGIWCFNIEHLKNRSLEVLAAEFGTALEQSQNLINEGLFEQIFYKNNQSLVFPVEPFSMNRRYSLQQSIFVSTGISHEPFMKQLLFMGDEIGKAVVKLEIPGCYKNEALRDLQQMNLNRASLFPDLDGYALSLRLRYDSMRSPREQEELYHTRLGDQNFPFLP